jgi:hypothetical protein
VNITNILKGVTGQFEITRVLGAAGVAVYIIGANVFEAWTVFYQGKPFDVVAYCAAFPTGLGVAIAVIAEAAGRKDKAVAVAKITQDTGALPAQPGATP